MTAAKPKIQWHRVAALDELPEGRVKTVSIGHHTFALTHHEGKYGALDNKCPHQGGPLGEGSIEKGYLRCPWHGWDYCPHSGKPPGAFDDEDAGVKTFPVEERKDGIYIGIGPEVEHEPTYSDQMVETMVNWGVTHVFGIVGHSNLGFAEALRRAEKAGKLTYIGVRHEGAASFAASGYAKLSGKPAACFSIAGPGATNLITGLWDAKVDRAPVLAISGQINTQVIGPGAFQEVDLQSVFQSVSKFNHTVLHDSQPSELMSLAFKNAIVQRDVSTLILPDEVQVLPQKGEAGSPKGRITSSSILPDSEVLAETTRVIDEAKRPVIVVGYGARHSMEEINRLAEKIEAPVITTFKGKGLISDHHPLAGGVLGRSGTPVASWMMNESDLLIVLGASFSNHTGITPKKPIIQVDFEQMQLGKFYGVDYPVWGEIGRTVVHWLESVSASDRGGTILKELTERWKIWREEKKSRLSDDLGEGLNSASIFAELSEQVPENAVISVDVGNNTYSFGRYFEPKGQSVLMSGYLGSIGFGFTAAMGAWAAAGKERPIVSISGDGGFGQYLGDFTTAVKYQMNITHFLLNNSELGKISKEQLAADFDIWQTSLVNPDFSKFAENCGGKGIRVTKKDQIASAIEQGLKHNGPTIVEFVTDAKLI